MDYAFPTFSKGKIGELGFDDLNAVFAVLRSHEERLGTLAASLGGQSNPREVVFNAVIVDHDPFPPVGDPPVSANRWKYAWVYAMKSHPGGPWVPDGNVYTSNADGDLFANYATNDLEDTNNGVSPEGLGVMLESGQSTLEMQPIPIGTPVRLRVGKCADSGAGVFRSFALPNAYKVTCNQGAA